MQFHESPPIPDTIADEEILLFNVLDSLTEDNLPDPVIAIGGSIREASDGTKEYWTGEIRETKDGFEITEYRDGDERPFFTTRVAREENGLEIQWTTCLKLHRWSRFSPEPLENDLSPFMRKLNEYFGR